MPPDANALGREFNTAIIEGISRLAWDHPSQPPPVGAQYEWQAVDHCMEFVEQDGMRVQAHHLAWGRPEVIPPWLLGGGYSDEETIAILREHVRTVVGRLRGRVHRWSAVTEPFESDGSYKTGPDRWRWWNDNSPWSDGIDPDYIEVVFREAHATDPKAILLLNDWDIEFINPRSDAVYNLVARLKQKEVPIHGVGMQMHLPVAWGFPDTATLAANMRRFKDDLGMPVYITEMSVDASGLGATRDERFAVQAEIYRSVFQAAVESGTCRDVCIFGVSDNETNVFESDEESNEFLFDDDYQRKPAYFALREELSKLPDM